MGTANSYQEKFHERYQFIELVNDANFGLVKVYRKKDINYDYVMILHKYQQQDNLLQIQQQIRQIQSAFIKMDCSFILKIFNVQLKLKNTANCQMPSITIYLEYLNYTLKELLQNFKQKLQSLKFQETVYILNSAIKAHQFLESLHSSISTFSLNNIFITTEGAVKFSPIRIKDFLQQDQAFCKALCAPNVTKHHFRFERTQKFFINQFRKLFAQIINYCPSNYQRAKMKQLQSQIDQAHTIVQIKKIIPSNQLEAISLEKRDNFKTQQSSNRYLNHEQTVGQSNVNNKKKSMKQFSKLSS